MTIQLYKDKGYAIAESFDQRAIDRAEQDIKDAYILPLFGNDVNIEDENVLPLFMDLVFLLLSQRNVVLTRGGAKVKTAENSQNIDFERTLRDIGTMCNTRLQNAADSKQTSWTTICKDICKISFKSNYYAL